MLAEREETAKGRVCMSHLEVIDDWGAKAMLAQYNALELARLCGVSDRQLRRYFVKKMSKPTQGWLNEVRLWKALKLLLEGKRVKEVSADLFFADAASFCHCFKRHFGLSPLSLASSKEAIRRFIPRPTTPPTEGRQPPAGFLQEYRESVLRELSHRASCSTSGRK